MEQKQLDGLKEWFYEKYVVSFYGDDAYVNTNLKRKVEHTRRICGEMRYLAKELKPQLLTSTRTRRSKAPRNSVLCPPRECPIAPMRPASTSGSEASRSTARIWLKIPFMVALAYPCW